MRHVGTETKAAVAAVALVASTGVLPFVAGYGTVLFQLVVLNAWSLVAACTSAAFANHHHAVVWSVALVFNVGAFGLVLAGTQACLKRTSTTARVGGVIIWTASILRVSWFCFRQRTDRERGPFGRSSVCGRAAEQADAADEARITCRCGALRAPIVIESRLAADPRCWATVETCAMTEGTRRLANYVLHAAACSAIAIAWLPYALWIGCLVYASRASLYLGHWPHYGHPDPKSLPSSLGILPEWTDAVVAASVLVILVGLSFRFVARTVPARWWPWATSTMSFVAWSAFIVLASADPCGILDWLLD